MKREIKYRAVHIKYDGTFSHFSYWGRIDHKGKSSMDVFTSPSQSSDSVVKEDCQFTSLLDKNGAEIYEEDIIKDQWGLEYKIVFIDGCFFGRSIDYVPEDDINIYHEESVIGVIGNIYENPKILLER